MKRHYQDDHTENPCHNPEPKDFKGNVYFPDCQQQDVGIEKRGGMFSQILRPNNKGKSTSRSSFLPVVGWVLSFNNYQNKSEFES